MFCPPYLFAAETCRAAFATVTNSANNFSANRSPAIRSGCHCTPITQFASPVHSTLSTIPSLAMPVICNHLPGFAIDW